MFICSFFIDFFEKIDYLYKKAKSNLHKYNIKKNIDK